MKSFTAILSRDGSEVSRVEASAPTFAATASVEQFGEKLLPEAEFDYAIALSWVRWLARNEGLDLEITETGEFPLVHGSLGD